MALFHLFKSLSNLYNLEILDCSFSMRISHWTNSKVYLLDFRYLLHILYFMSAKLSYRDQQWICQSIRSWEKVLLNVVIVSNRLQIISIESSDYKSMNESELTKSNNNPSLNDNNPASSLSQSSNHSDHSSQSNRPSTSQESSNETNNNKSKKKAYVIWSPASPIMYLPKKLYLDANYDVSCNLTGCVLMNEKH